MGFLSFKELNEKIIKNMEDNNMGIFSKGFKKANSLPIEPKGEKKAEVKKTEIKKPLGFGKKISAEDIFKKIEAQKITKKAEEEVVEETTVAEEAVEAVTVTETVETSEFLVFSVTNADGKWKVTEANETTPATVNEYNGKEFPGTVICKFGDDVVGYEFGKITDVSYEWNTEKERFIFTFVAKLNDDDITFTVSPNRQKWQVKTSLPSAIA